MDWIALVQDRNKWQAFVNTANNLRIPQNGEEFLHQLGTPKLIRKKDSAPWS